MTIGTHVILLGPQGSGKGTQAELLAQRLGVPHVSTGDMFRDHVGRGTELGQQVGALLKAGTLVPDDVTNDMVTERLGKPDAAHGFVLDGYPRNMNQAQLLAAVVPEVHVVELRLVDDEAVRRITGRRVCSACGATYHLEFAPPRVVGVCDRCSSPLSQRSDDTEVAVRERLATYHRETEPLLAHYRARGALTVVDGTPPIPEVARTLQTALGL